MIAIIGDDDAAAAAVVFDILLPAVADLATPYSAPPVFRLPTAGCLKVEGGQPSEKTEEWRCKCDED